MISVGGFASNFRTMHSNSLPFVSHSLFGVPKAGKFRPTFQGREGQDTFRVSSFRVKFHDGRS